MAINLADYTRTAAQRGWGVGWPSCRGAVTAGTAIVTATRSGVRFSVHKRIARLVAALVDETERRGYLLRAGQVGGYNCRPIGSTVTASNHSWGLAIDINWRSNPMRRPLTTDMPSWLPELWGRCGFAWGGRYVGTKDPMHFEFMGTPEQADEMTVLALRGLAPPLPPPPRPTPTPRQPPTIRRGDTGPHVEVLQRFLGVAAPGQVGWGVFGPATEAAVGRYQRMRGLTVDGAVGPLTWRATGLYG